MVKKFTIKRLIMDVESDKIDESFYWLMIPKDLVECSEETPCILATSEECEDCEDEYEEPHDNGSLTNQYITTIGIDTIREIFANLRDQIKNPSIDQKLDALIFYLNNDAFIEIGSSKI